MSITEAAATETPAAAAADDDDEISVLSVKPNSDNKGKAKTIEIDDDEIQLLFATNRNRPNKKRKETLLPQQDQFKLKNKFKLHLIHLSDDDDDEVQVIHSFPAGFSNSVNDIDANHATADSSLLIMCEICADEKPKANFVTVMGCDHLYCSECVASYVASKLQQNVVEITCPVSGCEGLLGPEHCRSVLPSQVYERWGTALCEQIICPSQKFYCPYKECSALMIDETQETGDLVTQMECPNCQRLFCVKCKVPWHKGVDCHEFQTLNEDERGQEDIMLVNLAKENLWKRCPSCKMYVQRSQGCNVMQCRCGCSFCYDCGGAFPRCHCREGSAHPFPIGGHYAINQGRHIPPLFNIPANQTLNNPLLQFQQGPIEVHSNASLRASLTAQRQSRRQRVLNRSANQTQSDPSILFPQGPVGGPVGGHRNTPNTRQGHVGDRRNTPNARQGPVGHLEWMQLQRLQNISGNQNQSNIIIQPSGASVSRTNEFSQESQSLPGTAYVDPVVDLSASQTRSYSNIPRWFASVARTNEFTQGSQVLPGTSHVDPVENLSASEPQLSGTRFATNHVWHRRQV